MRRALLPAAAVGVAGVAITIATASSRTLVAWIGAFAGALVIGTFVPAKSEEAVHALHYESP